MLESIISASDNRTQIQITLLSFPPFSEIPCSYEAHSIHIMHVNVSRYNN